MKPLIPSIPGNTFTQGDPGVQGDGTVVTDTWLNDVQAAVQNTQSEVIAVLAETTPPTAPDATKTNQLLAALKLLFLLKTGGTITGKTVLSNSATLNTITGNSAATPNTEAVMMYSGTNALAIGDVKQQTTFRSAANPTLTVGTGVVQTLYHTGNKPSAADIGALPVTGAAYDWVNNANITGKILISSVGRLNLNGSNDASASQGYVSFNNANGTQYGALYSEQAGTMTLMSNAQGTLRYFIFDKTGNGNAQGVWVNGSDERHKSKIKTVPNALAAVCSWRGATYEQKDQTGRKVGLIAQDVAKDCPEAISISRREFTDGTVIDDFMSLATANVAAAYHTEAIKELVNIINDMKAEIADLKKR